MLNRSDIIYDISLDSPIADRRQAEWRWGHQHLTMAVIYYCAICALFSILYNVQIIYRNWNAQ